MGLSVRKTDPLSARSDFWTRRVPEAFLPPPQMKPSAWAEEFFEIREGNRKGPYRHDNAPVLRGIMDICVAPGVIELRATGLVNPRRQELP